MGGGDVLDGGDRAPGLGGRLRPELVAVAAIRRIFDAQKAGHAGTLDPMATGILDHCAG